MNRVENKETETIKAGTDNTTEKLFTQEEVNEIIQQRYERMKKQTAKESESSIEERLKEIETREKRLLVCEKLNKRGMSKDLADIISFSDEKDLDVKLDKIESIYGNKKGEKDQYRPVFTAPLNMQYKDTDKFREVMGLK